MARFAQLHFILRLAEWHGPHPGTAMLELGARGVGVVLHGVVAGAVVDCPGVELGERAAYQGQCSNTAAYPAPSARAKRFAGWDGRGRRVVRRFVEIVNDVAVHVIEARALLVLIRHSRVGLRGRLRFGK